MTTRKWLTLCFFENLGQLTQSYSNFCLLKGDTSQRHRFTNFSQLITVISLNKVLQNIKQNTAISMTFNTPWAERISTNTPIWQNLTVLTPEGVLQAGLEVKQPGLLQLKTAAQQQLNHSFDASCYFIIAQLKVIPCCHTLQTSVVIWRHWSRREPWNDTFLLLLYL